MERTLIKNLNTKVEQEAVIKGWVYNMRSSGKISFLIIRDGSALVQVVVVKKEVGEEEFLKIAKLQQETPVIIKGIVKEEPRSLGGYEILASKIDILSENKSEYPITHKEHGVEFLADNRHLWIRTPKQTAVLKIRSEIENSIRNYFNTRDFILTDAPIITPAACEGTTNLFEFDYHGDKAYLSQSGQLYIEAAAMALGKVYCFGPAFRAEKSKTRRHLLEFWMVEAEMAFMGFEENLKIQEELVYTIVQDVLKNCETELITLKRDIDKLKQISLPFPRLSYSEAVEILQNSEEDFKNFKWGGDFGAPEETYISNKFSSPVFIHRYPAEIKAFYMEPDPLNDKVVLGADLIAPEGYGEIIGGGERISDLDLLLNRLKEHNLPQEAFKWYIDLRRFGSVQHCGFGLGLERTVAWLCGLEHIRETTLFPRMLHKMYP